MPGREAHAWDSAGGDRAHGSGPSWTRRLALAGGAEWLGRGGCARGAVPRRRASGVSSCLGRRRVPEPPMAPAGRGPVPAMQPVGLHRCPCRSPWAAIEAVQHTVAVLVAGAAQGVHRGSVRSVRAPVEPIRDSVAVTVLGAAVRIDQDAGGRVGAAVEPVGDVVAVRVLGASPASTLAPAAVPGQRSTPLGTPSPSSSLGQPRPSTWAPRGVSGQRSRLFWMPSPSSSGIGLLPSMTLRPRFTPKLLRFRLLALFRLNSTSPRVIKRRRDAHSEAGSSQQEAATGTKGGRGQWGSYSRTWKCPHRP